MTIPPEPPTPLPTSLFARPERLRERAFVGYSDGARQLHSKTAPESVVGATDWNPGPNPRSDSEALMSIAPHPCDRTPGVA